MAQARKDLRGRALRKGEVQRASDKRYMYTYTDPLGRRKFIYANDLATLREKEKQLMKDQLDGLDLYVAGKATINDVFDRYMSTKYDLRETTRSNYLYIWEHFVKDTFGKKRIADIKFSDLLQYYLYLLNDEEIALYPKEFDILVYLMEHPERLVSKDELITRVWGDESDVIARNLDNPIKNIRKQIEKSDVIIVTYRGYGYRMESKND